MGALAGVLAGDSSNIVNFISNTYMKISTTIRLVASDAPVGIIVTPVVSVLFLFLTFMGNLFVN